MWPFLDRLIEGIVIFDENKTIKYVNSSAVSLFDIKVGDSVEKILKKDDREIFLNNVINLVKKGKKYSNFMRFLSKEGELVFTYLNVFEWDGDTVFEIFDLSPIEMRSEGITDSSYVKILKYMSAGISHSIRNPIMSAGGMLNRIKAKLKELDSEDSEKLVKYIEIVEKSLYRIISIIANIEVVSNALPVKLERVNLGEMVRSVAGKFADRVNFELKVEDGIYVYADKMHIGFILEEIVKNSLDAVEGQSEPKIKITVYQSGKNAFIEVEDNGRGMSKEEVSLTTIPFYSTKPSNMGVGLSLAKFLIEGYRGSITIDSEENVGTKVTIVLPTEKRSDIRTKRLDD